MDKFVSSLDIVKWAIEDAKKNNDGFLLDDEKKALIDDVCKNVDIMVEEFEAYSMDAYVDEEHMLQLGFECLDLVVRDGVESPFFHTCSIADAVSMFQHDEHLVVQFSFNINGDK